MDEVYNNHYVRVDNVWRIIDGWSDGPNPDRDTAGAICINAEGTYQFRLTAGGEENPCLYTMDGIPLYKWRGNVLQLRTEEEIEADRALLPMPEPVKSPAERLDALEAAIERGLSL